MHDQGYSPDRSAHAGAVRHSMAHTREVLLEQVAALGDQAPPAYRAALEGLAGKLEQTLLRWVDLPGEVSLVYVLPDGASLRLSEEAVARRFRSLRTARR